MQQSRNASVADEAAAAAAHLNSVASASGAADATYVNYADDEEDYPETFSPAPDAESGVGYSSGRTYPIKCYALYDFQVSRRCARGAREVYV